jgi:N-acetylmuramoyl-L-alanine amidase
VKVAIDAGHGMSNSKPGVFDTGATSGKWREVDLTLKLALTVKFVFNEFEIPTFMTRVDNVTPCPLRTRTQRAKEAGCTHLISFHMNDSESRLTNGIETFYRDDRGFAGVVQMAGITSFSLKDREVKHESESGPGSLFILGGGMISCLTEVGFIGNSGDIIAVQDRQRRIAYAEHLASYFTGLTE